MKKLLCIYSLILIMLFCGCKDFGDEIGQLVGYDPTDSALLQVEDSVVTLSVYPENTPYFYTDKFYRQGFLSLTERQKSIYIVLDNAVFDMKTGYIGLGNCTYRDLQLAHHALTVDRPEYFWLPYEYSYKTTGQYMQIRFAEYESDWYCSRSERFDLEQAIKQVLTEFLMSMGSDACEYDRELAANDLVCNSTTYHSEALNGKVGENPFSWTSAGVFCFGQSVCSGYSKAFQMACFAAGLDCTVISGFTTEAHMWNCVKIDGEWYHVDTTSNDSEDKNFKAYFNVNDEILQLDRVVFSLADNLSDSELSKGSYNITVPRCDSLKNNYFVKNSLYVKDMSQLENTVLNAWRSAVQKGERKFEICLDPKLGFKCGKEDIGNFVSLKKCAEKLNRTLSAEKRIKTFSYGGVTDSPCVTVSW